MFADGGFLLAVLGCLAAANLVFPGDPSLAGSSGDRHLYEEDECFVNIGGSPGNCKKAPDCPQASEQLKEIGMITMQRCGFDNFTEIVCCPLTAFVPGCPEVLTPGTISGFGGEIVVAPEFPFIAALGYKADGGGIEYSCGGTIITTWHILTAAHCVHNRHKRIPVVAQLGALNVSGSESTAQVIPIKDMIWHEEHRTSRYYYDIAVIRLDKAIKTSQEIAPKSLPVKGDMESLMTKQDISLTVAGWGRTDIDGPLSDNLIKIERLSLADRDACQKSYTNVVGVKDGLADYMICVTDRNVSRKADTCPGDSGGPLLMIIDGRSILIGVTSFGQGCGGTEPGVYTAITPFLDWIRLAVCKIPAGVYF